MSQEADLRCRLQERRVGLAGTLAQRRLTKRSLELRKGEVQGEKHGETSVVSVNFCNLVAC